MSGLARFGFVLAGMAFRALARIPLGCGGWLLARARACDARGRPMAPDPPPGA